MKHGLTARILLTCLALALAAAPAWALAGGQAGDLSAGGDGEKKIVSAGDMVTFGVYPQTAERNDETPIEWVVLDVQGDKALLLSRYGLDAQPYDTEKTKVTWETCSLRTWLNVVFMNKAFGAAEQTAILLTDVDNGEGQGYGGWSSSGGNNTRDKVFLLSYAEANKYFGVTWEDSDNVKARTTPTAYAIGRGAFTNDEFLTEDGAAAGWWWLRSPGDSQDSAAFVLTDGTLCWYDAGDETGCVRPALWVDLGSGIF